VGPPTGHSALRRCYLHHTPQPANNTTTHTTRRQQHHHHPPIRAPRRCGGRARQKKRRSRLSRIYLLQRPCALIRHSKKWRLHQPQFFWPPKSARRIRSLEEGGVVALDTARLRATPPVGIRSSGVGSAATAPHPTTAHCHEVRGERRGEGGGAAAPTGGTVREAAE
jgi:hypothetical protein